MTPVHVCMVCFADSTEHLGECRQDECAPGARHWPPLCCPGCPCGSWEDAHTAPRPPARRWYREDRDPVLAMTLALDAPDELRWHLCAAEYIGRRRDAYEREWTRIPARLSWHRWPRDPGLCLTETGQTCEPDRLACYVCGHPQWLHTVPALMLTVCPDCPGWVCTAMEHQP